ncbi:MAG: AMP-binding protein, partial [Haloglomus sp.]
MVDSRTAASLDGYARPDEERIDDYRAAGYWTDHTLHEVLDRAADAHSEKPFVVGPNGVTYGEFAERTERVAAYLRDELGLAPRERVVVQLTNRVEFLELLFGCSRAGVIPVVLLPRHRRAEASHVTDLTDARAFVTLGPDAGGDFDHVDMAAGVAAAHDHLDHLLAVGGGDAALPDGWTDYETLTDTDWTATHGDDVAATTVDPNDPGIMLLSGGTTGMPKVIPRTHNEYAFQWERWGDVLDIRPEWTGMPWVPIGHNASLNPIVGACIARGASIAVDSLLKTEHLVERALELGVDYFFAVPTQLVDLLEYADGADVDLASLSLVVTGGQKARPRTVRDLNDRWDVDVANNYGMAEGPLFSTRPGDDVDVQAETIGRPIAPDADDYRIVDEARSSEVPTGDSGELAARGPGIFTGYFRNDAENESAFDDDGWFYTEDVLERDADGNYRVHGRLKDTIIRGGENIYAPGVE